MNISEFIQESKNKGLKYAVLKKWDLPLSYIDLYNLHGRDEVDRITIKDRKFDKSQFFLEQCLQAYPNRDYDYFIMQSNLYRNNSTFAGTRLHKDPYDILHWQCVGATEWKIGLGGKHNSEPVKQKEIQPGVFYYLFDSSWESEPETILLEPGDLLWFSAGVWHETTNITEKYALVFEAKEEIEN